MSISDFIPNLLSILKIGAAVLGAYLAWQNQNRIIELLQRMIERPASTFEAPAIYTKEHQSTQRPGCGEYHYRDHKSGNCRDARKK